MRMLLWNCLHTFSAIFIKLRIVFKQCVLLLKILPTYWKHFLCYFLAASQIRHPRKNRNQFSLERTERCNMMSWIRKIEKKLSYSALTAWGWAPDWVIVSGCVLNDSNSQEGCKSGSWISFVIWLTQLKWIIDKYPYSGMSRIHTNRIYIQSSPLMFRVHSKIKKLFNIFHDKGKINKISLHLTLWFSE